MRHLLVEFLCLAAVAFLHGCTSASMADPPEYDALRASPGGSIVIDAMRRYGYPVWRKMDGMRFELRTRIREGDETRNSHEIYTCDLKNDRVHARANAGDRIVERVWSGGRFRETRDGVPFRDTEESDLFRRRTENDHFFAILPFFLCRTPGEITLLEDEEVEGVKYRVIEMRYRSGEPLPPDERYLLYFTRSTQRLEKLLFPSRLLDPEGRYIWCDIDNFQRIDGILVPLHRRFTYALDETGKRMARPFLEQWLTEVGFDTSVNSDLFQGP